MATILSKEDEKAIILTLLRKIFNSFAGDANVDVDSVSRQQFLTGNIRIYKKLGCELKEEFLEYANLSLFKQLSRNEPVTEFQLTFEAYSNMFGMNQFSRLPDDKIAFIKRRFGVLAWSSDLYEPSEEEKASFETERAVTIEEMISTSKQLGPQFNGGSFRELCFSNSNVHEVGLLLKADIGVEVDVAGSTGGSALHAAVASGSFQIVEVLLKNGSKMLNDQSVVIKGLFENLSPLMILAVGMFNNHPDFKTSTRNEGPSEEDIIKTFEVLLEAGVELDLKSNEGNTALHFCVINPDKVSRKNLAMALVKAGADKTIKNNKGKLASESESFAGAKEAVPDWDAWK